MNIDYFIGQRLRFRFQFKTPENMLADPTDVRFKYRKPSDTDTRVVTYPASPWVKESTGVYHIDIDLDEAGTWKWREETDGLETADQGKFRVVAENV